MYAVWLISDDMPPCRKTQGERWKLVCICNMDLILSWFLNLIFCIRVKSATALLIPQRSKKTIFRLINFGNIETKIEITHRPTHMSTPTQTHTHARPQTHPHLAERNESKLHSWSSFFLTYWPAATCHRHICCFWTFRLTVVEKWSMLDSCRPGFHQRRRGLSWLL